MLTARSTATSPLDVIRLTLEMLSGGRVVPAPLQEHFNNVLAAARALTKNPRNPPQDVTAEAVHLAFELLYRDALRQELEHVTKLNDVDQGRASRLLAEMEQSPVHP